LLELLPPPPLDDWSQALDVELQLVAFDPDSADTLASEWAGKLDGLYLLPLWQLDEAAQRKLLDELSSQKLATFSHLGMDLVERGALAGLYAQSELERVAKRVAIDVSRALDGEDVAAFETQLLAARPRLTLNLATARKLELRTSWELLDQAELMHQDPPAYDGSISLAQAMQEVLASPVLAASRMEVELRRADVDALEGRLWPSIELGLNARVIDADRATNLANEPEFKGTVYAELEQLIYSDRVWTGLEQKEELVAIEDAGLLEEQLDWRLKAATVYLNVLQARGLVEIRREALRRSRSNLELARLRVEAGSANEADVYRWEIMLLQSQQELREAKALEQQARIGLNLLLGRPAEAFYDIEELGLEAPEMITSLPGFLERLGTPQDFELFRDYLVEQALGQAPELRKLDAAVAIKEAETARLSRSYWLPELGLQAGVSAHFLRAGEGSEPLELDITLPPPLDTMIPGDLVPDDLFPQPDAFEWFVGFGASWALWEGGAREQAFDQTELELMQLQSQRAALHLKLEQEVRAALIDAGASYPKIASTQEALVSAHAALELVTDAYRRGAVTVAELVDAQNAASTVESAAAIAVYAFLIDVLEVERAMGRFSIDLDVLQKQAWLEQMNQYFDAREATP
jgi:outer membrane protein TolC